MRYNERVLTGSYTTRAPFSLAEPGICVVHMDKSTNDGGIAWV